MNGFPSYLSSMLETSIIQPDPARKLLDLTHVAETARYYADKAKDRDSVAFRKRSWGAVLLASAVIAIGVTLVPAAMVVVGIVAIVMPPEAGADLIAGGLKLLKKGLDRGIKAEALAQRSARELQSALDTIDPDAINASRYGNFALQGVPGIRQAFERAGVRATLAAKDMTEGQAPNPKPLTM